MKNTYRLLIWSLIIATISTTTLVWAVGAPPVWPIAFGMGLLVAAYFYGKWMESVGETNE